MLIAYIDCYAGLSGESLLEALVSAGLPRAQVSSVSVDLTDALGNGDSDTTLLAAFEKALKRSTLPTLVKQVSKAVLARLREAEAAVYTPAARSVFQVTGLRNWHAAELGALVGVVYGLSLLGIDRLECSPLRVGCGSAEVDPADLKLMPSLSPVAAELLRAGSIPVYGSDQRGELITPIGAAFASTLVSQFGPLPAMKILSIGYGLENASDSGTDLHSVERARQTRIFVGEALGLTVDKEPLPFSIGTGGQSKEAAVSPPTHIEAVPEPVRPYVESLDDWIAISIQGHQESGRIGRGAA
ncbi:MAG TPA: nickel insertion protein [Chloroflexia bacterium]|nr:nickel insertion protein [Chloroflexia bacterium]